MILMYHKVHMNTPTEWWVSVDNFYRQMVELSDKKVVYLDDYDHTDPGMAVITFDGVYQNVLEYAVPIMEKFGYPFELFITSDTIGKGNEFDTVEPLARFASEEELSEMVRRGGRLQWHTKSHPDMKHMTEDDKILSELQVPAHLKDLDPAGFNWFAYPYGNYNEKVREMVSAHFGGALSCIQGNDTDRFLWNRITMLEDTSVVSNKLAVIVASYNYGSFLIEALESVLHQTYRPSEILITDDCSTDNTREIAEDYVRKYPSLIRYNRNEENLGVVKNFNKAVSMTSAEYVCFLGADNRFVSNYLEMCVRALNSDKSLAIAYTDYAFFGPRAEMTYHKLSPENKGPVRNNYYYLVNFPEFNERSRQALNKHNFIHGSSMYRRKAYDQIGGYLDTSGQQEDFNLFQRMVQAGWQAVKVKNAYLEYRQHSKNQLNNTFNSYAELNYYKNKVRAYEQELAELKNSLSWKLTAPLRADNALMKGRVGRLMFYLRKHGPVQTGKQVARKLINRLRR